jgi:hypothetical protein
LGDFAQQAARYDLRFRVLVRLKTSFTAFRMTRRFASRLAGQVKTPAAAIELFCKLLLMLGLFYEILPG